MAGLGGVEHPLRHGDDGGGGGAGGLVDDQPAVHRPAAGAAGHRRQSSRSRRTGGRAQELAGAVHLVEAGVGLEGELGREAQVDPVGDEAAELDPVAAERAHHLAGVDAAERQHEGGGVAQVRRDAHLGHGDRDMRELRVVHVAAGEDLGERAADHLADAQLALAGRAAGEGSCLCHAGQILSGPREVKGESGGEAMADEVGIAVVGASGRMGRMLVRAVGETPGARLSRRHRAAGPPLDRARRRRGDGRRGARGDRRGRPAARSSPAARRCSTSPRPRRRCCMPSSRRRRGWCT